jgi:hypothetical protein
VSSVKKLAIAGSSARSAGSAPMKTLVRFGIVQAGHRLFG